VTKFTTSSVYTIAIILCIIGFPIIIISSIVGIVQEIRRVHAARSLGEHLSYAQPKLLAEVAALLFIFILAAAGAVYAGIAYNVVASNLTWVSFVLIAMACLCGLYSLIQRVGGNSNAQKT